MPRTVKEYQRRWRDAMAPGNQKAPWDENLSPVSCVIYETAHATPQGEGCSYLPDFGDALCFYRYLRIPEELDSAPVAGSDVAGLGAELVAQGWSWGSYRAHFSGEEIRRRRYEGERALDKLLARFVREDYQPDMGAKLIDVVNATLIDFALHEVYVLPDDLPAVLSRFGNPFMAHNARGGVVGIHAEPPAFDLNAPGHREALAEHLIASGR
jgi:hypothetical protein